ncbi:MAG: M61 family metallopeptidase [Verrucomicrobiales bacterium]
MKIILFIFSLWMGASAWAQDLIRADLDATEIPRGLLRSKLTFQAKPGRFKVWYPKWIPGVHGPVGPVQNMAGLTFETASGKTLKWTRDDLLTYQFFVEVPEGEKEVVASMDYICNQPSVNSTGVDSYGNGAMGIINLNTCLLYPDGADIHQAKIQMRLKMPADWQHGTSLQTEKNAEGWITFAPVTFEEAVDSPIIMGKHVRQVTLRKEAPAVFAHFVSESESAIQVDEKYIGQLQKTVSEANALFGKANFREYHFLVGASDQIPPMGLEHLNSSLNVVGERDLVDEKKRKLRAAYLLPHEFVHSWCGKYRRPAGMVTPNFHTDKQTKMLWVYEGLAQYLGDVLMVRGGQFSLDDYRQSLALDLSRLINTTGRKWRSLEDTAVVAWQLRGRSKSWGLLRRSQDYYDEGMIIWMEIDAVIRSKTSNQKSLDDFCRAFFAPREGQGRVIPFEHNELIETLNSIVNHDWQQLIEARVNNSMETLSLDFLDRVGYRLEYSPKPPGLLEEIEKVSKASNALDSLGMNFAEDGKITEVVPGMPGDKAGLAPGMDVEGINNRKFNKDRLLEALSDSVGKKEIEILVLEGDRFKQFKIPYSDGPRFLQLTRNKDKGDILADIYKPLVK